MKTKLPEITIKIPYNDRDKLRDLVSRLDWLHKAVLAICEEDRTMKYEIGDMVTDEDEYCEGVVVIKWDDGDVCYFENDAAHPNPKVIGNINS